MCALQSPDSPESPELPVIRLKFWGVRGSIPTPGPTTLKYGGNTSCIEVRAAGHIIILDAGTGLRLLGNELMTEFREQPMDLTLLLTHTHWDHIQGLPFFMPVYQPKNHLRILGYEGARVGLETVLNSQMESPFFPIGLNEVPANVRIEELKEWDFKLNGARVQARYACHPGVCVGYRISAQGHSIAFFPDNELPTPQEVAKPESRLAGRVPVWQTEGLQSLADFVRGVDVLVMDSQYDADEYDEHIGWGHGCMDRVVSLAIEAGAKQLYLFHHDPNHDDATIDDMVAHARKVAAAQGSKLKVDAAREGLAVEISG